VNPDLATALVTAGVSLILGVLSFVSASRAARADKADKTRDAAAPEQAERSAYERAAGFLEDALDACREENRILRAQLGLSVHPPKPDDERKD
jgi:hypothetical protein